jgi:hypothetical protein
MPDQEDPAADMTVQLFRVVERKPGETPLIHDEIPDDP